MDPGAAIQSETSTRKLDLAARAIDLTHALVHVTSSSSPLIKGAWEIGQWLGREKLNQYELEDCMKKAKGLVIPNQNGRALFDDIIQGVESKPTGPLFLEQSGSLGRLMARDPNLSWMISTVACLFQFHRDDRFVSQTLTAFIMRAHAARQPNNATQTTDFLIYNPVQVRIRSVISKIVLSVWHNVVNAGCDTIPLPSELLSVCSKGHYLDPDDFSIVTHTLYSQCRSKAILRSDHLLRNIMLWLFLHYDGLLVVNVGGKIIYEKDFGNPTRELEVHVKSACFDGGPCDDGGVEAYEILRDVAGKFEHFLSGHSFSSSDIPPQPGIRQKLYEIPRWYPRASTMWNNGIQILVKCTAQSIMRWLLQVPVFPQENFSELGFSAALDPSVINEPKHRICDIFKRVPAIINLNWGNSPPSQLVFVNTYESTESDEVPEESRINRDLEKNSREEELEEILPYFPILQDLLRKISSDCNCNFCQRGLDSGEYRLRYGCLQRVALEEAMLLVAHGIADGFNVSDVSAITDVGPIIKGMTVILLELCKEKKICWDSWFGLAASVYLGCPFRQSPKPDHPAFGGTAVAAIQYGNLAAQAPWLDLSNELEVIRCFGLIGARGRLGVITKSNQDEIQFRSVEENFAIIETEGTEDTSVFNSRFKKDFMPPGSTLTLENDKSSVKSDVILISVHDNFYRLLMRIKTPNHWRVIDPSDAMNSIIRSIPIHNCPHESKHSEILSDWSKLYSFEELLGRWPDTVLSLMTDRGSEGGAHSRDGTMHITHILDTHFKQNVALALSSCTTAVQNYPSSSCSSCTLERARKAKRDPLRQGEGGNILDRYIINVAFPLDARQGKPTRKLIQVANTDDLSP